MKCRTFGTVALALAALAGSGSAARGDGAGADPLKRTGFFGAQVGPVTEEARKAQKLEGPGVLVLGVLPGTPAEEAGFKTGDVITSVDGAKVAETAQFVERIGKKGGEKTTLAYVRGGEAAARELTIRPRPHEAGHDSYNLVYDSIESRGRRLRTVWTVPKTPGKHPALLLIQGLGGFSIENAPAGPGLYAPFIDDFARRGYVTLRVDDPGAGDSEGGPTRDVDFDAELDGYRQGLKALAAHPAVDADNVLIFGHSMGGVMAPLLAVEPKARVKGIAVYGTVIKTWYEYFLENTRRQTALTGATPSAIDQALKKDVVIFTEVFAGGKTPAAVAAAHPELRDRVNELSPDGTYLFGRHHVFFRQLAAKDVAAAWDAFGGHALALWGKAEFVSTESDHAMIAAVVNKNHPGHGTFVPLDGIDHGFNRAASAEDAFQAAGGPREFNPVVVTALRDWAARLTGGEKRPG